MSYPSIRSDVHDPKPVPLSTVSEWLRLLNSPEANCEPSAYLIEKLRLESFREKFPEFSKAAASWPDHASLHWDALKPQILELFTTENSFNFVQWALEYAREKYSSRFKFSRNAANAIIDLTERFCDGSITPLHMAALLGIPSLCQELIARGADVQKVGVLGTPLYCALVGPPVLAAKTEASCWIEVFLHNTSSDRASAISHLLDAGADCTFRYKVKTTDFISAATQPSKSNLKSNEALSANEPYMTGLAFRAASISNNHGIFSRMFKAGAVIDENFLTVLKYASALLSPTSEPLFVDLVDLTIEAAYLMPSLNSYQEARQYYAIEKAMKDFNMSLDFKPAPSGMTYIPDEDFSMVVRSAITENHALCLRRLISDPRFDPNTPASPADSAESTQSEEGTIAHLAVSGDHREAVDILIQVGADLTVRDGKGRTPLMVAETPSMLDLLVTKYHLPTTDSDDDGRTIWHYAAATNDGTLLEWLCQHDPFKLRHLEAKTCYNQTPLDEALCYVTALKGKHQTRMARPQPAALLLLLKEMEKCSLPAPPLIAAHLHLAVAWGVVEVVDSLAAIGADFNFVDREGNTIFHHLNFSAKPPLIRRLHEICEDLPVTNNKGICPAETIFNRSFEMFREADPGPKTGFSAHPACWGILDEEAYLELLTPDILQCRDATGKGFWERYCDMASSMLTCIPWVTKEAATMIISSLEVGLKCLIKRGAMKHYEDEKRETSLQLFKVPEPTDNEWDVEHNIFLVSMLRHSDKDLLLKFYQTEDAYTLLSEAWEARDYTVLRLLVSTGMPLHVSSHIFDDSSFVEHVLSDESHECVSRLRQLLDSIKPEPFFARPIDIYRALVLPFKVRSRSQRLELLLQKGLDPNVDLRSLGIDYCLPCLISRGDFDSASILLRHGADPTLGDDGSNAVIIAASKANFDVMSSVISVMSEKFPDFNWDSEWDANGVTYNALQIAASFGRDRIMLLLLERTPLKHSINKLTTKNRSTPAHLAALRGHTECLNILHSRNADLTLRDGGNRTPLMLAVDNLKLDTISFLLRIGVADAASGFHHACMENKEAAIEVFVRHGFSE